MGRGINGSQPALDPEVPEDRLSAAPKCMVSDETANSTAKFEDFLIRFVFVLAPRTVDVMRLPRDVLRSI